MLFFRINVNEWECDDWFLFDCKRWAFCIWCRACLYSFTVCNRMTYWNPFGCNQVLFVVFRNQMEMNRNTLKKEISRRWIQTLISRFFFVHLSHFLLQSIRNFDDIWCEFLMISKKWKCNQNLFSRVNIDLCIQKKKEKKEFNDWCVCGYLWYREITSITFHGLQQLIRKPSYVFQTHAFSFSYWNSRATIWLITASWIRFNEAHLLYWRNAAVLVARALPL